MTVGVSVDPVSLFLPRPLGDCGRGGASRIGSNISGSGRPRRDSGVDMVDGPATGAVDTGEEDVIELRIRGGGRGNWYSTGDMGGES